MNIAIKNCFKVSSLTNVEAKELDLHFLPNGFQAFSLSAELVKGTIMQSTIDLKYVVFRIVLKLWKFVWHAVP